MKSSIKIGTRGSRLALWQANHVQTLLQRRHPELHLEQVILKTTGDLQSSLPIPKIGTKNVFVKEIEEALRERRIDIAVHSLKDTASASPEDLVFDAFLGGVSRQDVLLTNDGKSWKDLTPGARVASGSKRRVFQLKKLRADLECVEVRGNVDTRIRKLEEKQFDALILAAAGLERLGLTNKISHVFSVEEMVPAGGQGIVAVQLRKGDTDLRTRIEAINEENTALVARAEFAFLRAMSAGCDTPLGTLAQVQKFGNISWAVFAATQTGNPSLFFHKETTAQDPESVGSELAGWVKQEWQQKTGLKLNWKNQLET